MFDLDIATSILLIVCLIAACGFEFVNGFHDTANAVATVIYTHTLKPWTAVIWSGVFNFLGVLLGGVAVAVQIINLLPIETLVDQNVAHSISMIMAILLTAILWNLMTWYYGLPCSSSHTLIGSIIGVGLAFTFIPGSEAAVNLDKAKSIGMSLLLSPLFGFSVTIVVMYLIRRLTKKTDFGEMLFKEPKKNSPPPLVIRGLLLLTCTLVSYSHGSNDGQKGVGLMMLILIGIVPSYFALNTNHPIDTIPSSLVKIEQVVSSIDPTPLSETDRKNLNEVKVINQNLQATFVSVPNAQAIPKEEKFTIRKNILITDRHVQALLNNPEARMSLMDKTILKKEMKSLRQLTDYSPRWVVILISLSLGFGTMIGWKRIVKTIGEKIGKEHLTYAQGASAESVAAMTIGLSSYYGLPVSTTHVLSSGIAGSMVANKGMKNLQPQTIRNILIAWFLTLPVVVVLSGLLFLAFRQIF